MKCWTFYRRSTDRQELSIEDQRKACEAYAKERGWAIVREFVPPRGYASGLTIENDPAFLELVREAERGSGGYVLLIYDVSRLGRLPPKRKFYWEEHLRRHQVRVVYVAEPFSGDGSLGDDIHQFVSHSEAHQYSLRLSKSTIRGAKSHAALGRSCGGRPPLGYARELIDAQGRSLGVLAHGAHKADKTHHIRWTLGPESEVQLVKAIFEAYARGSGLGAICDDLNSRGIPAPRGGAWAKNTVQAVLKNEAYLGRRVYFKHAYHDRTGTAKRVRPKEEWTVTENAHPPIIDRPLWDRVQSRFQVRRPRDGRHQDSPYLLSGLVRCGRCGHRFYGQKKKGAVYYVCGGFHTKGKAFCSSFSVQGPALERLILDEIERRISQLLEAGALRKKFQEIAATAAQEPEPIGEEAGELDRQIKNMVAAIASAGPSPALVAELRRLEASRTQLQRRSLAARVADRSADEAEAMLAELQNFPRLLAHGTVAERKLLIKEFLAGVSVQPDDAKAALVFHKLPFLPKEEAELVIEPGFHRDRCGGPQWSQRYDVVHYALA